MTENKLPIRPYPLGAHAEGSTVRFSFVSDKDDCGIILCDKSTGKELHRLPFTKEERLGRLYCKYVDGLDISKISYQFYEEKEIVPDRYGRGFTGVCDYGKLQDVDDLKAVFLTKDFDWEEDTCPRIPYSEAICYCMHVRGFTKHASSGVKHKGTFAGIAEKLDYLAESGFTTVELQPAYEFAELEEEKALKIEPKLNYWGYKKGYYYAPKAAYAAGADASLEFKELVKAFHQKGLELVMQFYFPQDAGVHDIAEILRFWVLEYHVDGFHLMGENLPINAITSDAALADTKIWYYGFEEVTYENLADYSDDYLYDMRKFLKGDEDMLDKVVYQMRHIPENKSKIHYLTNYYGMTLMDLVSYDHKHNEANGEANRDGNNYNYSWNCGEEGPTRRKKVQELRYKQIKNAFFMLLFSQSTPLLFMGDEFGNSQKGNNNPYCQDNAVTWLNWKDLDKNKELYLFWKKLVILRKENPILHPKKELRIMDYLSLGYPDLSYHGENAWKPELIGANRQIGMMFCGQYAKPEAEDGAFLYLAVNMHWEYHELAMPKLPKGMCWELLFDTTKEEERKPASGEAYRKLSPRTIAVFVGVKQTK